MKMNKLTAFVAVMAGLWVLGTEASSLKVTNDMVEFKKPVNVTIKRNNAVIKTKMIEPAKSGLLGKKSETVYSDVQVGDVIVIDHYTGGGQLSGNVATYKVKKKTGIGPLIVKKDGAQYFVEGVLTRELEPFQEASGLTPSSSGW